MPRYRIKIRNRNIETWILITALGISSAIFEADERCARTEFIADHSSLAEMDENEYQQYQKLLKGRFKM